MDGFTDVDTIKRKISNVLQFETCSKTHSVMRTLTLTLRGSRVTAPAPLQRREIECNVVLTKLGEEG